MEDKEYKKLMRQIKREQEEVKNSKEAAKKFLIKIGVLTPDGDIKEELKALGLCIQPNQD